MALAGFPKVAGGLAGHVLGIVGHAQQLGLAGGVGFLGGYFAGKYGVALGPQHNGFAHDDHGFKEGALFAGVLAAQGIKGVQLFLGFLLDAVKAALQDLFKIVHPLDGRTEGRGFVDNKARDEPHGIIIGELVNFAGQGGVEGLVVGLAFPVGGDFFNNALGVFGRDCGGRGFAGGQIAHRNIQKVAVQFGVQNAVTAIAASAAKQQLVFLHVDGHVLRNMHKGLGPAQHQGLTVCFLHGLGEVQGAFDVDARLLTFKAFQQLENAGVGCAELVFPALDLVVQPLFLGGAAFASGGAHHDTPEI